MAVNKFKIGDHVRGINGEGQIFKLEGVIVAILNEGSKAAYLVNYGPNFKGHHGCGGGLSIMQDNPHNWWETNNSIELIDEENKKSE